VAFILKIKNVLISPRTIIFLIILTLIACVIGFFVPQVAYKSPSFFETWQEKNIYTYRFVTRLQLQKVFTSYWFLALVILQIISLISSIYKMALANVKKRAQSIDHSNLTMKNESTQINNFLRKRRYRITVEFPDKLIFIKNSVDRWGSTIFHFGLLLIIISALLVACLQKRGFAKIIEGEAFDGKEQNFEVVEKGVLAGDHDISFITYLSKLDHKYWEAGKLRHLKSHLTILGNSGKTKEKISINNPLLIDGINIYQSYDYGYTLSFTLKKSNGEEVITQFNLDRASNVSSYTKGISGFPLSSYMLGMKFIPDLDKKSFYLNKPIVYLNVDDGLNRIFKGLVVPGSAVKIQDDILYFSDVRFWSGLIFTSIPGISLAYSGFAIVILGISVMFLLPYKEIHVNFSSDGSVIDVIGIT